MPIHSFLLPVRRPYAHCAIQRSAPTAVTQRTQQQRRGSTRNGEGRQPAEAAAIEQHITITTTMTRCSHLNFCVFLNCRERERE